MHIKDILRKLLTLAICGIMLTSLFPTPIIPAMASEIDQVDRSDEDDEEDDDSTEDAQDEIDDLNSQYDEIKAQQDAVQNELNQAANDKASALAQQANLNNQIYLSQQQIAVLEEKITLLTRQIETKQQEIADLEQSIDYNYGQYKERLNAMYRTGSPSLLAVALGADEFSDFLMQSEMLNRIAEHDQALLDQLEHDKILLEQVKAGLDADKIDLDESMVEVEELKASLGIQLTQTNNQIQDLSALEAELLADKASFQAKMAAIQAEIDAIYETLVSQGEYVGGMFAWPTPGYTNITSYFGWRFGGSDYHTGIDMSGSDIYGKSIVAANSGTVVFVRDYDPGGGYGKYLIVDHGGGYTTLYAHCSEIMVSVGDSVSRMEPIAKVGSTGWSTGPHLHYEIRIDAKPQNPLNFY